jgi:hypothetical protein
VLGRLAHHGADFHAALRQLGNLDAAVKQARQRGPVPCGLLRRGQVLAVRAVLLRRRNMRNNLNRKTS